MDTKYLQFPRHNIELIDDLADDGFDKRSPEVMDANPFKSFWMAGFECTDKLNAFGIRVDLLNNTGHLHLIDQDYKMLSPFRMGAVREGIRWSQVEKNPYQYDWSAVEKMIRAGKENNIQQIWD